MSRPAASRSSASQATHALLLLASVALPVTAYLWWAVSRAGKLSFGRPWVLLLLVALPALYWAVFRSGPRRRARLSYSSTVMVAGLRRGPMAQLMALPSALRVVALVVIVLALARPQTRDRGGGVEVEGIDMVVALDLSNSMESRDVQPNRLEAAKRVLADLIRRRRSDRIGLVVFGKDAYTACPLTLDYSVLENLLAGIRLGYINGSATAIGNALGLSLARLRKSDAKSRVVILLTDGENNSGNLAPQEAARYARSMKVKVFTILIGSQQQQTEVQTDIFGRPVAPPSSPPNPKLLEEIARETGGQAFLATDRHALERTFERILAELDRTTRRDVAAVFVDAYRPFVAAALLLLLLEALLRLTRLREFP